MKLQHDFTLDIATAHSRLSKKWKNKKWQWSELVARCSETKRTGESVSEYMKMTREEQSDIKDVGGFVGGYLKGEFAAVIVVVDVVLTSAGDDVPVAALCVAAPVGVVEVVGIVCT